MIPWTPCDCRQRALVIAQRPTGLTSSSCADCWHQMIRAGTEEALRIFDGTPIDVAADRQFWAQYVAWCLTYNYRPRSPLGLS